MLDFALIIYFSWVMIVVGCYLMLTCLGVLCLLLVVYLRLGLDVVLFIGLFVGFVIMFEVMFSCVGFICVV